MQALLGMEDAGFVRMMSGFGGGVGGMGSVCGAILGGVAALSLRYGRGRIEETEDPRLYPLCAELYRRFGSEVETSPCCRDITATDFTNPAEIKAFYASPEKRSRCGRLVGRTAELVREILEREAARSGGATT